MIAAHVARGGVLTACDDYQCGHMSRRIVANHLQSSWTASDWRCSGRLRVLLERNCISEPSEALQIVPRTQFRLSQESLHGLSRFPDDIEPSGDNLRVKSNLSCSSRFFGEPVMPTAAPGPTAHSLHATIRGLFNNSGHADLRSVRVAGAAECIRLSGPVRSYYMKAMAASIAITVPGVLRIQNEIEVRSASELIPLAATPE